MAELAFSESSPAKSGNIVDPNFEAYKFTPYQKLIVALLAILQFTIILDFMILSPLGAVLMPAMNITPSQFGMVVSIYAFSAGASGFLAAGFADLFDRKKMLMFFYFGFLVGTLCCALAPNFYALLGARMVTGIFGGVIGSIIFAISTDLFPMQVRGRVMGTIQASFAASQVLGIPIGLFLSNHWGWHMPFLMIVGLGSLIAIVIALKVKPIDSHLKIKHTHSPFKHLFDTITTPRYLQAFATTALMSTGGFMLMPFSSAFSVHNIGISLDQLPMIYMITGVCAMLAGPTVGRLSDQFGKFHVFHIASWVSVAMVLIYTHLDHAPITTLIVINVVLFTSITSRIISSMALISAVPTPESRGSFMAVSSSLQQISGGIAAVVAGMIVSENADHSIRHFDELGYIVASATLITVAMMYLIDRKIKKTTAR